MVANTQCTHTQRTCSCFCSRQPQEQGEASERQSVPDELLPGWDTVISVGMARTQKGELFRRHLRMHRVREGVMQGIQSLWLCVTIKQTKDCDRNFSASQHKVMRQASPPVPCQMICVCTAVYWSQQLFTNESSATNSLSFNSRAFKRK